MEWYTGRMNEQPQQNNLQPDSREGEQPLYRPAAQSAPSSFSGYDLAHDAQPAPTPVAPASQPSPTVAPAAASPLPAPVPAATPIAQPAQPLAQDEEAPQAATPALPSVDLRWEASEYVHHTKSFAWYAVFGLVMFVLLALAFFVTHSWTFMLLVVVMSVALGIYASRPPRTLHYALTNSGIQIEDATYKYSDFRAFGIMNDGALFSIMLIPAKRFLPAVNIYFVEDDGEAIVDILGARLPMEEIHLDVVDRLMRRLRF